MRNVLGQVQYNLTSGTVVADVTIQANATRITGSNREVGSVQFKAKGSTKSRVDYVFPSGQRTEILSETDGAPSGIWIDASGTIRAVAVHNVWTDASWFCPAFLRIFSVDPDASILNLGQQAKNGVVVQRFRYFRNVPTKSTKSAELLQRLSAVDVYVDTASLVPVAIEFNAHPDDATNVDIPIQIRFSDYRDVVGTRVPFHIQKVVNGTVVLDFSIISVSVNTGLLDTEFVAQGR